MRRAILPDIAGFCCTVFMAAVLLALPESAHASARSDSISGGTPFQGESGFGFDPDGQQITLRGGSSELQLFECVLANGSVARLTSTGTPGSRWFLDRASWTEATAGVGFDLLGVLRLADGNRERRFGSTSEPGCLDQSAREPRSGRPSQHCSSATNP